MRIKLLFFSGCGLILILIGCHMLFKNAQNSQRVWNWSQYGGGADQSKYVKLKQITKANVARLQVAWVYPAKDQVQYLFNPIIVDGTMYVLAKNNSLVALDAVTGKELWIHANLSGITWRGINYWKSTDGQDRRLIFTMNNTLQEINASTGQSILSFGDSGIVDLRKGLERDPSTIGRIQSNTPGVVYKNMILLGSSPGENIFSAPGHLRAFDIISGKQVWIFHTIPLPGEYGYETWPKDAYKYVGGVNCWGEISLDENRGIAYFTIGSPTYDYYGADRIGMNLFSDCLLALDANTGKRLWHFQMTHHDLWDYDLTAAPQLIQVKHNGKILDAVAQATKQGFMFVFDRVTGEPLWPIEERPVPASNVPEEQAWPTQPFPTVLPPFTRHEVKPEDINPYFDEAEAKQWKKRITAGKIGFYTPPSDKYETFIIPGAVGGANFGNTAADPAKGIVYVATQDYPSVFKLEKVQKVLTGEQLNMAQAMYVQNCQACHGADHKGVIGPSLEKLGNKISFDNFKNILAVGKGQMPGFPHINESSANALYRFLGGGSSNRAMRISSSGKTVLPDGPVVASGGAPVKTVDGLYQRKNLLSDYPDGVPRPKDNYTTDYGLQYPNLMSPPWSSIMAYDLNKGTIKWRRTLGQDERVIKKGGGSNTGLPIGSQRKGMIVTSSGILFATSKGGKLYAFDAETGAELWRFQLDHETQGLPAMYEVNGKQYIVVSATAPFTVESEDRAKLSGAAPPGYVVFALPDKK